MKVNVIPIGNSMGIRIPSVLLKLCHIKKEVDLEVENDTIMIKPLGKMPRHGWAETLNTMHKNSHDQIIINDNIDLELENWEW